MVPTMALVADIELVVSNPDRLAVGPKGNGRQSVQSLARALDILEALADSESSGSLSELATRTGVPAATTHRLLQTLMARGYVRQPQGRHYALGPQLMALTEGLHRTLRIDADPYLRALAEDVAETANLALLDGDYAFNVAQALPHHGLRMFTEIGRQIMVHCTAVGKVLAAQLSKTDVDRLIGRVGMPTSTAHTVTDLDELHRQLDAIRQVGYAIDDGEQEVGVRCVAVPVRNLPHHATISVAGPDSRLTHTRAIEVVPRLQAVAQEFAAGWQQH